MVEVSDSAKEGTQLGEGSTPEPAWRDLLDPPIHEGGAVAFVLPIIGLLTRFFTKQEQASKNFVSTVIKELLAAISFHHLSLLRRAIPELGSAESDEVTMRDNLSALLKKALAIRLLETPRLPKRDALSKSLGSLAIASPMSSVGELGPAPPRSDDEPAAKLSWQGILVPVYRGPEVQFVQPLTGRKSRFFTLQERRDKELVKWASDEVAALHTSEDLELLGVTVRELAGSSDEAVRREVLAQLFRKFLGAFLVAPPLLPLPDALRAENVGREVRVQVQIAGQGDAKNLPQQWEVPEDTETEKQETKKRRAHWIDVAQKENWPTARRVLFDGESRTLQPVKGCPRINFVEASIRPLPGEVRYRAEAYRPALAYFLNQGDLPSSHRVELTGIVTDDDKRNLTILVYDVHPLELDFEAYKPTAEDLANFDKYFRNNPNLLDDLCKTVAPHIVGRDDAKIAAMLALHSPLYLKVDNRTIRGGTIVAFIGDSTNGKSEIMAWCFENLKIGERAVGESASRAGLSYYVDPEKNMIIFGTLPMADRTIAYLDGMQSFPAEELPQLREVLRSWRVVVTKKVQGEAPSRCRIILAANPRKPLKDGYTDKVECLADIASITDPNVELTRIDLIIPFATEDVPPELIARATSSGPPAIPIDMLQKHVFWSMSLGPDAVVREPAAIEEMREGFKRLMEHSTPKIPLVHNGYLDSIERISADFAVLRHNVAADGTVRVTVDHVREGLAFIEKNLDRWEYLHFVRRREKVADLSKDEEDAIKAELAGDLTLRRAYEEIRDNPGIQSAVLASKLGGSKRNAIDKTNRLKALGIIESQPRSPGYRLNPKGNTLHKRMRTTDHQTSEAPSAGQQELQRVKVGRPSLHDFIIREMPVLQARYDPVPMEILLLACEEAGLARQDAEKLVPRMVTNGELYMPEEGTVRLPREGPTPRPPDEKRENQRRTVSETARTESSKDVSASDTRPETNVSSKELDPDTADIGPCSVCGQTLPRKPGVDGFVRCQTCLEQLRKEGQS